MHKDVERILISQEKLEKIVNSLAKQIEKDYNGREFIMVGLLKGSIVFMAELMTKINLDFRIDFMVASSYGGGTESSGKVKIVKDLYYFLKNYPFLDISPLQSAIESWRQGKKDQLKEKFEKGAKLF